MQLPDRAADLASAETECIASVADAVEVDEIVSFVSDGSDAQNQFFADMFDDCLTDEHQAAFFAHDIEAQTGMGFTPDVAACMAPGFVRLVDSHGFADVFETRTPAAAADIELVRLRCGVIGPSRAAEAKYFAGVRNGDQELLRAGICDGVYTAEQIVELASRIQATDAEHRPTPFRLISSPTASPEIWTTTIDGQDVSVEVSTDTSNFACVMQISSDPRSAMGSLAP